MVVSICALREEVVVGEAPIDMRADHRWVAPVVISVPRDVARHPPCAPRIEQAVHACVGVAQIERDDLGGPKPVVRLEASAGWRGADLLAVIVDADADAHNRALLVYLVLHMHDRAAVRVEEISAEVAHRCAVGEDVGVELETDKSLNIARLTTYT